MVYGRRPLLANRHRHNWHHLRLQLGGRAAGALEGMGSRSKGQEGSEKPLVEVHIHHLRWGRSDFFRCKAILLNSVHIYGRSLRVASGQVFLQLRQGQVQLRPCGCGICSILPYVSPLRTNRRHIARILLNRCADCSSVKGNYEERDRSSRSLLVIATA
jgi:hypothetical protein